MIKTDVFGHVFRSVPQLDVVQMFHVARIQTQTYGVRSENRIYI